MKRLAAITFLTVVLFNFYGYQFVISYMQSNSEVSLEMSVDKNEYNEADLITIKTKLNLPYYTGSEQYERAYGAINIEGTNYQYVKRRVHNDTLELLCLPNHTKTKLQSLSNDLTRALADGQSPTPKKNTTIKIPFPDFYQPVKIFSAWVDKNVGLNYSFQNKTKVLAGYQLTQERPPRIMQLIS